MNFIHVAWARSKVAKDRGKHLSAKDAPSRPRTVRCLNCPVKESKPVAKTIASSSIDSPDCVTIPVGCTDAIGSVISRTFSRLKVGQ